MIPARGRPRVVVLPAEPSVDVAEAVRRAGRDHAGLLVLSLGYPPTEAQRDLVARAMDLGCELCVPVEARLVWTVEEAGELARRGREICVAAVGTERRELQTALRIPHPELPGVALWEPLEPPSEIEGARGTEAAGTTGAGRDGASAGAGRAGATSGGTANGGAGGGRAANHEAGAEGALRSGAGTGGNGKTGARPVAAPGGATLGSESVEALAGRQVPSPTVRTHWTAELAHDRKKGSLRIYLGAAPGVGKTFAMLGEGQRRMSRGTDVVVGYVETYGRPLTEEMLTGLEIVPRRLLPYRGSWFEEMDPDAIVDRHPGVVLVDELAHTNVPGSRRAKRWEDVLDILAVGIDVVTTINVQHLESLNDVVVSITSIRQQETVPDWVVDLGDQIELVDMSPEALQRRMRHGNVYPDPAKAELALRRFFTLENLTALRELALMRVADRVDSDLLGRWSRSSTPETRERILVCVSGSDLSEALVRRGGRMAHRVRGDLFVLHVRTGEEHLDPAVQSRIEALTRDLAGELHIVDADSVVDGILGFARRQRVTQCVVGETLRPAWQDLLGGSVVNRLIRGASEMDIHVIARRAR